MSPAASSPAPEPDRPVDVAAPPAKRIRMEAADRRMALLDVAQEVFSELGYSQTGLAEIARRAGVSKTLLYHYYPDGRPELYREVSERLVADLLGRTRRAVRAPISTERRLAGLVDAVFGFFADEPAAFGLLLVEPWAIGDPSVLGPAMSVRVQLASEISSLVATSGAPHTTIQGAAAAAIGSIVHECGLWLAGQIARDLAIEVTNGYVRGGLRDLRLL
jgi:AcrR family transcriptional regulator